MPEWWSHWKNHIPSGVLTPVVKKVETSENATSDFATTN